MPDKRTPKDVCREANIQADAWKINLLKKKKKTVAVMNKHFLEASRVTPGIFYDAKV